jgi:hypothetical protein
MFETRTTARTQRLRSGSFRDFYRILNCVYLCVARTPRDLAVPHVPRVIETSGHQFTTLENAGVV